jgi:osmotically inducible lipoprotein OsmB
MKPASSAFIRSLTICICILSLTACTNMNNTQQRTLSGAAVGAGVGTAATLMTGGCVTCGAAVGAAVGAGAGYVYDKTR